MTKKIIVTGGEGRFAKILKKKNKKLNLIFLSKKQYNILNIRNDGAKQKDTTSAKESISFPNEEDTPILRANLPSKESNRAAIKINWHDKLSSPR